MTSPPTFSAEVLRVSSAGLARLATQRLLPRLTPGGAGLAPDADRAWCQHLTGRLADLAQALDEGRPSTFVNQVAWSKVALTSRAVPLDDLRASLECLADVLASELSPVDGGLAGDLVAQALHGLDGMQAELPAGLDTTAPHGELSARYVLTLLEGDRAGAGRLVREAVQAGQLSVREALLDVCLVAQRELGRMWHMNEITVAEEHLCTAATVRLVSQLMGLAPAREPNGRTLLAASSGDDEHDMGLRIVSELYELDGWRVVFLGARLPAGDLAWSARTYGPDLVLLSATMDAHRAGVAAAVRTLRDEGMTAPVLVGGPAFPPGEPALWEAAGADAWAPRAADAVSLGRRLVGLGPD